MDVAAFIVGVLLLGWAFWRLGCRMFGRNRPKPAPKPSATVTITDEEIISSGARRPTERVAWRDLTEVAIVNEDAFPIGWQYWLLIGTGGTGAVVPSDADGAKELLEALQTRLPGFDNAAVIAAMGSLDGAFRVWKKAEPAPGQH